jgi:hypothetical protein
MPRVEAETGLLLASLAAEQFEQSAEPLPSMRFHFASTAEPAALLRQLGVPSAWPLPEQPAEIFHDVYGRAAAYARELATRSEVETPIGTSRPRRSRNGARATKLKPENPP